MTQPSDEPTQPPRRRRYAGKNPRRFQDRYKELAPENHPGIIEHVRARGRTPAGAHVPILVAEVLACLAPRAGETFVDCTVGFGGHAIEFLRRLAPGGRLIGFDVDQAQLQRTGERLAEAGFTPSLHHGNFAGLAKAVAREAPEGVDAVFADLGVSSMQLDDPARGFSYKEDGPLDMRMDARRKDTAADLLAKLSGEELSDALRDLADEEDHERIARGIEQARSRKRLGRTQELVDVVFAAKGITRKQWKDRAPGKALHPAARTFLALRILVNDELATLRELLRSAPWCLRAGGRIALLTFHSGEDRLVKHAFEEGLLQGLYREISPEVIRATNEEIRSNPRASSAKLRWAIKP
ncbi:MAG: 16S rRNA (cytosine(1402)-N(4))-methyltransferase RsmH [Planctomycetota bacterium]|nr:16S rRNA (cytosine(1402)-N(4))-methyltransferase RsmH [Planctomycetota bacterium]